MPLGGYAIKFISCRDTEGKEFIARMNKVGDEGSD
jgi:hypothetical protein